MSRRAQENLVALALLTIFAGVLWLCQDFGARARMIPLPLAIFGLVLTVIQIIWQNVRSTDELKMDLISVSDTALATTPASEAAPKPSGVRDASWALELRAYGLVALLIALLLAAGIIPAVFVFTAGYFILTRQYSWLMGLIYTSAFTACVYVLFFAALQIEPYHGLLAPLAERFR